MMIVFGKSSRGRASLTLNFEIFPEGEVDDALLVELNSSAQEHLRPIIRQMAESIEGFVCTPPAMWPMMARELHKALGEFGLEAAKCMSEVVEGRSTPREMADLYEKAVQAGITDNKPTAVEKFLGTIDTNLGESQETDPKPPDDLEMA